MASVPNTKLLWVDTRLPYPWIDNEIGKSDSLGAVHSLVPNNSPLLPNLGPGSANAYIQVCQDQTYTCSAADRGL